MYQAVLHEQQETLKFLQELTLTNSPIGYMCCTNFNFDGGIQNIAAEVIFSGRYIVFAYIPY